jgi:lysine 2,3-aminomutase
MKLSFKNGPRPSGVPFEDWQNWSWQMRHALRTESDFAAVFELTSEERQAFSGAGRVFQIRSTPYYAALAAPRVSEDPIRKILMPHAQELSPGLQAMLDPLGERQNRNHPASRIIHRYPDRVLFLVTDTCSVYCRYCTRKHFTGADQAFMKASDYDQALSYIKKKTGIREVILSGGDPLTLSDGNIDRILTDLRAIEHVEIIRIGSRMPVVCPMRVTPELALILRRHQPVFMMTHFNHPREITREAADALGLLVDNGIPVFNQLVLLNGINNSAAVIQALSRRLLFLRVKPYYMFQCDPSEGTDHLRTSVENSLEIQRELWGRLSGLAMPTLALDIPDGGGKAGLVPDFQVQHEGQRRRFTGWDGISADYLSPAHSEMRTPIDTEDYEAEWAHLKDAKDAH